MNRLSVVLPLPVGPMHYLPPFSELRPPEVGMRVVVPWRGGLRVGVICGLDQGGEETYTLRHAVAYLDGGPALDQVGLALLRQGAEYFFTSQGQLLMDLASFLEPPLEHRVHLVDGADPALLPPQAAALTEVRAAADLDAGLLEQLRVGGLLEESLQEAWPQQTRLRPVRKPGSGLTPKMQAALQTLWGLGEAESQAHLARAAGVGVGVVKRLLERGWVEQQTIPWQPGPQPKYSKSLKIAAWPPQARRMNGGRLMERISVLSGLLLHEPALVLFPKVSLLERFLPYFQDVLAFHGEQPALLRRARWSTLQGQSVFATYLGILMPGLPQRVVIVEEGSGAYKLLSGSRLNAARLAELRAHIIGSEPRYLSAVPSVETIHLSGQRLAPPKTRVLPIDLQSEAGWPLTGRAKALLQQIKRGGRQAIVLATRLGYAGILRCKNPDCRWQPGCPNCALPLRYHRPEQHGHLVCHQCGHTEAAPDICPRCGFGLFSFHGPGMEWLAETLADAVDLPVWQYTGGHKDDLSQLEQGRPGLLLGTTALLHAPTPPELAMVLLPFADGFLGGSDFRSAEHYHTLLWHLADLHPGRRPLLALQTFEPRHPAIKSLELGDMEKFVSDERTLRQTYHYPPSVRMVKIEVSHRLEAQARDAARALAEELYTRVESEELLGPSPAPVPRLRGRYIFHLLLRSGETSRLSQLLAGLYPPTGVRLRLDPDPMTFVGLLED